MSAAGPSSRPAPARTRPKEGHINAHQRARHQAEAVARQLRIPHPGGQTPQSLSGGAAGIALLHIERAATGHADWQEAHDWLRLATRDELAAGTEASLYYGAPALAFALHSASHLGYRSAQALLDKTVSALTRDRLAAASQRLERGERPALAEFDLISGLTGLGAHWWRRDPSGDLIKDVLAYLIRLTEPVDDLPGWWTLSSARRGTDAPPGGHSNHGMAHGIAGPLALLSLTARAGLMLPGQLEAIGRICGWLDQWQHDHLGAPWWPETTTLAELQQGRTAQPGPRRPSWCYGTPGLARAQQLAAIAIGDTTRQTTAASALTGCLNDPHQLQQIVDGGLCHGTAGLFMTVAAFAADAIASHHVPIRHITDLLLNGHAMTDAPPGFLTGHAGYGLALHALADGALPTTTWDACLLLR
ncbi:lanthionine synthetase C family protein [Nonomuraea sp. NPDC046802]|uniref:lanthionine synthetase C family protein n=1 Tax=Nonomuraea sp. NPDC046802 TaxID=3154919 RepID=UPI0033EFFB9C